MCGYCGDGDAWCGGKACFHIDHFRPVIRFEKLECDYSNLVYACSYCNIAKSDDWPCTVKNQTHINGEGYIDPCDVDFVSHFERQDDGQIRPRTNLGQYMFKQLKLGLHRHQLIWLLTRAFGQLAELSELRKKYKGTSKEVKMMTAHMDLWDEFARYKGLLDEGS
jgi:hypothetical protein